MEWLRENAWAVWLIASLGLLGAELLTLDLVLLMLAVGAGSAAVVAALGAGAVASLATAVVVSVGMLAVVRPSLARRLHHGPELTTGHEALVGRTCRRTRTGRPARRSGAPLRRGVVGRAYDPTLVMAPGSEVHVMEIDGATALVYPTD
jgi:membrane protein implicated in regulation of membrane protease activity